MSMTILYAAPSFKGIAAAPAYCYRMAELTPVYCKIQKEQILEEQEKFLKAKQKVEQELESLSAGNEIFAAHLELVRDVGLSGKVLEKIEEECKNAQLSLYETIEEYRGLFERMESAYMRERGADIKDVGKRLMAGLEGVACPDLGAVREEVIVAAKELLPSDTVKLDPSLVKGILTEEGGITSHASIMAKSMNIPVLVGVKGLLSKIRDGEMICMDAEKGIVVLSPDEATRAEYQSKKEIYEKERLKLQSLRKEAAITRDGKRVALCANVGSLKDIQNALPMNIDGIGLFRSEFLYMENSHFPTEEEQFAVYQEAARLAPMGLTIRTLDIGGDKALPYQKFEEEENPFLGFRAVRVSLGMREMFKEQLRAILRAGACGKVRILIPMLISLEELKEVKELIGECKCELKAEGKPYDADMQLGILMETPASVFLAEEFAKEADFFSIGTNDLTQYLLAVDRGNPKVADRFDYFHPAVLKAVAHIIQVGHEHGLKVGMCGEMAADPKAIPLLLSMGLDEFSMAAGSIDYIRKTIREY